VLKRSRKKPIAGDVFVMHMPGRGYLFGLVASVDARMRFMEEVPLTLVYVYKYILESPKPIPLLKRDDLLIPPQLINERPWTTGVFQTVEHRSLTHDDLLPVHCFRSVSSGRFYDDAVNELPDRVEPCGEYGFGNERTSDDKISEALGVPLAPD